ncbi:hypothetical protein OHA71_38090 [Streptomyces sp. NBC_00444]|uniref:hypothetical protein n=1 Tax=Streptomyces sp. NBC_00444 TaxID=2975744 RepID=UPI002E237C54
MGVLGTFAPQVTSVLSGAGRQSNGWESVRVRELAQEHFGKNASSAIQVVVSSKGHKVTDASVRKVIAEVTGGGPVRRPRQRSPPPEQAGRDVGN